MYAANPGSLGSAPFLFAQLEKIFCNLDFENVFEIENVFAQLEKNIVILTLLQHYLLYALYASFIPPLSAIFSPWVLIPFRLMLTGGLAV